jgi:beta-galactosidase
VGPAVALRMTPITGPQGLLADGSDVVLIDVEAVDAKGDRCPTFQQRVDFEVSGPGVWRGGYNSGKTKSTNNTWLDLEAGVNRVAVRATRTAGAIAVKVKGEGLKPASLTVRSKQFPAPGGLSPNLPPLPAVNPAEMAAMGGVAPAGSSPAAVAVPGGRYVTAFSYSGPAGAAVRIIAGAKKGALPYTDSSAAIEALPAALEGADYVQTAQQDKRYSAVDLMEVAVKAGSAVWIAWDERIGKPAWLTNQFQATPESLTIGGRAMKLYRREAARAESLTLGSNAEKAPAGDANMYLVLVGAGR